MQAREKVSLVYPAHEYADVWETKDGPVISVSNLNLLTGAFEAGISEFRRDIERVIFDRSISAVQFLEFLSRVPTEYRGDILLIGTDGTGYLSAALPRGDGRTLFSLSARDTTFYLETVHSVQICDEAPALDSDSPAVDAVAASRFLESAPRWKPNPGDEEIELHTF